MRCCLDVIIPPVKRCDAPQCKFLREFYESTIPVLINDFSCRNAESRRQKATVPYETRHCFVVEMYRQSSICFFEESLRFSQCNGLFDANLWERQLQALFLLPVDGQHVPKPGQSKPKPNPDPVGFEILEHGFTNASPKHCRIWQWFSTLRVLLAMMFGNVPKYISREFWEWVPTSRATHRAKQSGVLQLQKECKDWIRWKPTKGTQQLTQEMLLKRPFLESENQVSEELLERHNFCDKP